MTVKSLYSHVKSTPKVSGGTAYAILFAVCISHLLNDMIQSVVPAIYPILKESYGFTFAQIGLITLAFQIMSSLLQPFVGRYADRHPHPYSLAIGMCFTLAGLFLLAFANSYLLILASVCVIGWGSSIFHPEASRVAQMASGGKKGLAQSIFQVGGNGGSAIGPLLAALIILPFGQKSISWFAIAAVLAASILVWVGNWYRAKLAYTVSHPQSAPKSPSNVSKKRIYIALSILVMLIFSKYFYISCMTSYFTFFLIYKFQMSVQNSQLCLFAFLAAIAIGTLFGGVIGDRFGRKYVILGSIFGAAPFTLLLPYVNLFWSITLAVAIGLIIASAFSAILVYATDLMPDKVGMIAGIFYGLMFGLGGVGSAFFGWLADATSISFIFQVSAYLPLLGAFAIFLPNVKSPTSKK